jgi:hypothetical protein
MIDTIQILLIILILLDIVFFFLGYTIGRLNSSQTIVESQPVSFFNKQKSLSDDKVTNKVIIDERKFVTDIKTSGMEKKYENLGETKISNENIESSINKLKYTKDKK